MRQYRRHTRDALVAPILTEQAIDRRRNAFRVNGAGPEMAAGD